MAPKLMTADGSLPVEADRAVRAVLDDVLGAWANDADAFVAPFAATATAILPGVYLSDRAAIRAAMVALWAGELKRSSVAYEIQSIRLIGADIAIVVLKGAVLPAGQTEPDPAARAMETWVLARSDETWQVHAFHNCPERR